METHTKKVYNTFLPLYPGHYYSFLDGESYLEGKAEYVNSKYGLNVYAVFKEFADYKEACAKYGCSIMERHLRGVPGLETLSLVIVSEKVYSPKYYDCGIDSVEIEVSLGSGDLLEWLLSYAKQHETEFAAWLNENYEYIPSTWKGCSDKPSDWYEYLNDTDTHGHIVGELMGFVCLNEGIYTDEGGFSLHILEEVEGNNSFDVILYDNETGDEVPRPEGK